MRIEIKEYFLIDKNYFYFILSIKVKKKREQ